MRRMCWRRRRDGDGVIGGIGRCEDRRGVRTGLGYDCAVICCESYSAMIAAGRLHGSGRFHEECTARGTLTMPIYQIERGGTVQ